MTTTARRKDRELETAANRFHALSDPTRLRILMQLAGGERCVCELTGELEAAKSRLSFHLRTLKDAGLVRDRREGRWVYYALEPEVLGELSRLLGEAGLGRWRLRVLRLGGNGKGCC